MNKKGKKTIGGLLLVISLAMIGYGVYLTMFSPKMVMLKMVITDFENLFKAGNEVKEKLKTVTTGTLNIKDTGSQSSEMAFNLGATSYVDGQNNKALFEPIIKQGNVTLASPKIYYEKDKIYFKLDESDKSGYYISLANKDNPASTTETELLELKKVVKNQILKNISDKSFKKSKENTTVNDNNLETTKYTLDLSYLDAYNVINGILLEIKDNKELSHLTESLYNKTTPEEVSKNLREEIIGKNKEDSIILNYSIYVTKDKIVKHELKSEASTITIGKYEKETGINDYELLIKESNKTLTSITIIGEKDSSKINITTQPFIIEGTTSKTLEKESATLNIYLPTSKDTSIATFTYEAKNPNSAEYTTDINFELKFLTTTVKLTLNNKVTKNQEVPKYDVTGAQDFVSILKQKFESTANVVDAAKGTSQLQTSLDALFK